MTRMKTLLAGAIMVLGAEAMVASPVIAQDYPSKPIRIISPVPPGGLSDVALRPFVPELHKALEAGGRLRTLYLIEDLDREARRSHLLFLSLETCTVCNHRCPFCPVSVDPREREVMPQTLFESIVDQTAAIGGKDVVVFLSNYNEPTVDPLFEERCRALFERGMPVSILTNASQFTPDRAARLEALKAHRARVQRGDEAPGQVPEGSPSPRHRSRLRRRRLAGG